jgi:hypothetical protein
MGVIGPGLFTIAVPVLASTGTVTSTGLDKRHSRLAFGASRRVSG